MQKHCGKRTKALAESSSMSSSTISTIVNFAGGLSSHHHCTGPNPLCCIEPWNDEACQRLYSITFEQQASSSTYGYSIRTSSGHFSVLPGVRGCDRLKVLPVL